MWRLLGYKNFTRRISSQAVSPASDDAAVAYAVFTPGDGNVVGVFASVDDAIAEASKLEIIVCQHHPVRPVAFHPAAAATAHTGAAVVVVDLQRRLALADLPKRTREAVDAHSAKVARAAAERDRCLDTVAAAVGPQWDALVTEFRAKKARIDEAKDAAARTFVHDRGMPASRVREIHDANERTLSLMRATLRSRGEKLVEDAIAFAFASADSQPPTTPTTIILTTNLDELVRTSRLRSAAEPPPPTPPSPPPS